MKRTVVTIALFIVFTIHARAATQDEKFEKVANDYIDGFLAAHPERATEIGDHRFDDRLSDYSAAGQAKELSRAKQSRIALKEFGDGSKLTGPNKIDLHILADNIDREIFELEQLKEADWNPLVYNRSLAESLYSLAVRDFDTPQKRIEGLRKRMEAVPRVIEQAKKNLQHSPRLHTSLAIEQIFGVDKFLRLDLDRMLVDQSPDQKKEVDALQITTAKAIDQYLKWLMNDLLPRSDGKEELGAATFEKNVKFLTESDSSAQALIELAKDDLTKTQAAMYETALPLYQKYFPQTKADSLDDRKEIIKAVLGKLAEQHTEGATIVSELKKAAAEGLDFAKSHDLVTIPDIAYDAILMPELRRGEVIVHTDSPGPLDKKGEAFLEISPPFKTWPQPRQLSFYLEYNNYMLRALTAQQLVPGYGLLKSRAKDFHGPTRVRTVFPNRAFVCGWQAYAGQIMADAGFGGAEVKMQQLKLRLRVDCNAVVDQGVHAGGMGEHDALAVFRDEGFQENGEQIVNWRFVRLAPGQATAGFDGMIELLDLSEKAKAKAGVSFKLKRFNDDLISSGSPPVSYLRDAMGL